MQYLLTQEEYNNLTKDDANHPTGISSKWSISKDKTFHSGEPNPCPCDQHPDKRLHYLLTC